MVVLPSSLNTRRCTKAQLKVKLKKAWKTRFLHPTTLECAFNRRRHNHNHPIDRASRRRRRRRPAPPHDPWTPPTAPPSFCARSNVPLRGDVRLEGPQVHEAPPRSRPLHQVPPARPARELRHRTHGLLNANRGRGRLVVVRPQAPQVARGAVKPSKHTVHSSSGAADLALVRRATSSRRHSLYGRRLAPALIGAADRPSTNTCSSSRRSPLVRHVLERRIAFRAACRHPEEF